VTTPVTHTTQQLHFNSAEFDDLDRYFAIGCAGYGSCHDAAAEDGSGGLSTREEIAEALPSEYEELLGDPEGWGDFHEVPYVGGLLGIPTNAVEVEKCGSLLKSLGCLPFLTIGADDDGPR
jgi:hypothetical protein